jgi:phosphopantothenate synthetase
MSSKLFEMNIADLDVHTALMETVIVHLMESLAAELDVNIFTRRAKQFKKKCISLKYEIMSLSF